MARKHGVIQSNIWNVSRATEKCEALCIIEKKLKEFVEKVATTAHQLLQETCAVAAKARPAHRAAPDAETERAMWKPAIWADGAYHDAEAAEDALRTLRRAPDFFVEVQKGA